MAEAVVPPNKRFCSNCNEQMTREKGFCPKCGRPYSFVPSLKPGDVVAGQYEVVGCMAFGGLGWIYLGKDNVLSRWVVLKGLLNSKDEAAAAAAVAERQFLAAVKHPNIVGVYNFVQRGAEGYTVMEYVGGKTLKEIRKERGPLPVPEAIAYIHRILGAFAYLHRQEPALIYCDFKPDNFMVEDDDVKLIDMGGVRRVDDTGGDIYGTRGYSAPEAGNGPSVVSDLYTVARTLAVLITDFRGLQSAYEFKLPPPEEQPVFAQYESLYRFLLKATRDDPDQRFQTADEMADQLAGVLREIVAQETGVPRPAESLHFGGDAAVGQDGSAPAGPGLVPALKVDATDLAAQFVLANAGIAQDQQVTIYQQAVKRFPASVEAKLRLAKAFMEAKEFAKAEKLLAEIETEDPFEWRAIWARGLSLFIQGKASEAAACFNQIYSELPGELAPKLGLALAAEAAGEREAAIRFYDIVSRTDPSFTTATFGLARCLVACGRRDEAVAAYGRVPSSSSAYVRAQISLARAWLLSTASAACGANELQRASQVMEAIKLEGLERHRLAVEIQEKALELLESRAVASAPSVRILGQPLNRIALRSAIEDALRGMARLVKDRNEKIALVDLANHVRPSTLF